MTELPRFSEGETITIHGTEYEVTDVDLKQDGVRWYYLQDGTGATSRLDPSDGRGYYYLTIVVGLSPEEIERAEAIDAE